jgi:hypothetical protein
MFAKSPQHRSEAWRRAVASLPCACCMREGATQAAHPNHRGKGMGMKAPDCWTVPLCVDCHREFDQGSKWSKAEKRELMDAWILLTVLELASNGSIKAKA